MNMFWGTIAISSHNQLCSVSDHVRGMQFSFSIIWSLLNVVNWNITETAHEEDCTDVW